MMPGRKTLSSAGTTQVISLQRQPFAADGRGFETLFTQ